MNTNNNIEKEVDRIIDSIDEVKVSPFFKDKTMQRLFSEKEEKQTVWSWFTPQLQLATLACIVILNLLAISQLDTDTYSEDVDTFAETYELSDSEETIVFN